MTGESTFDVGRATIDAYLDLVEQAMLEAHAPRSDRTQVLADLESQIADMLAREPQPLTEEAVTALIERLESPYHFAAMYGNGKQAPRSEASHTGPLRSKAELFASIARFRPRRVRGVYVAAICFALPLIGLGVEWALHLNRSGDGAVLVLSTIFGILATPCALALAFRQVRTQPEEFPDRDMVLNMSIGFAILAPAFLMIVLTEWTYGLVLVPLGIAAFAYLQIKLVRKLHRYLVDRLPPAGATNMSPNENRPREAAPAVGGAMTMPAL